MEAGGQEQGEESYAHIVYSLTGSVVKVKETGEVVLISANDRYELNQRGQNRKENDIDYFLQLFSAPEDRISGVYTADLLKNMLWTRDDDRRLFKITSKGEAEVYSELKQGDALIPAINRPTTPYIQDGVYIDPENENLQPPKRFIAPRLFVINNNDTGSELLSYSQLRSYLNLKENDPRCYKMIEKVVASYDCQSFTFLSELQTIKEMKKYLIKVDMPTNVDILPYKEQIRQRTDTIKFIYRNLLKYSELSEDRRNKLHADKTDYQNWLALEKREFGEKTRSEEERQKDFQIQTKILESRRKKVHKESHDEKFEAVSSLDLKKIWDEIENFLDTNRTDKLADVNVTLAGSAKKKEKKEKPKLEPKPVLYHIWNRELEAKQLQPDVNNKNNEFKANYYGTYIGEKFVLTLPEEDRIMIKKQKKDQKDREEFLKKTMSHLSRTGGSDNGGSFKPEAEDLSKPATTIPQSEDQDRAAIQVITSQPQKRARMLLPSHYRSMELLRVKQEDEEERAAEQIRTARTKDFNVYGAERPNQEFVACLARSTPNKQLNVKFITIESEAERRLKVASQANRMHLLAPSVMSLRNQDDYHLLRKSLDKKYTVEKLTEQKNLMLTASLSDNLKRDINILPSVVDFGTLKRGRIYEYVITVKNEDVLPQRLAIRNLTVNESYEHQYLRWKGDYRKYRENGSQKSEKVKFVKAPFRVDQKEQGLISMGISRAIFVQLDTADMVPGEQFEGFFEIWTRHEIYKIPVKALPLDPPEFEQKEKETKQLSKHALIRSSVKELMKDEKGRLTRKQPGDDRRDGSGFLETGGSESLPRLNFDRNTHLDPTGHLKQNQRKESDSFQGSHYED